MDFLRNSGANLTQQGYSNNVPIPQQFFLELKAGTVIPGILITGLNSDLPGPILGQVSENVWDSTHGRYVLIPKGTRIIGAYDSRITYGQKRILVVWNRLIFPNGTTLNIASSPGLDQSGYSGMRGKVDEHWGRMINAALFASLFVTGAEMLSPRDNRLYNVTRTPGEIASEQVANAILDISSKLMNKNMDIQPTLTIRPGRRFNIFVEKDVVFTEAYPIGLY
jgi:type IV secretion system protein VirB10